MKKEHVHRAIWLFMAVLFIVTALGVGVYAFLVNTHNGGSGNPANNYIKCPIKSVTAKQSKKDGKLQGAKLAGFTPIKHVDYLQCQDLKVGNGATATAATTITALYTVAGQQWHDFPELRRYRTAIHYGFESGNPGLASRHSGHESRRPAPLDYPGSIRLRLPSPGWYSSQSDLVFDITLLAVK